MNECISRTEPPNVPSSIEEVGEEQTQGVVHVRDERGRLIGGTLMLSFQPCVFIGPVDDPNSLLRSSVEAGAPSKRRNQSDATSFRHLLA